MQGEKGLDLMNEMGQNEHGLDCNVFTLYGEIASRRSLKSLGDLFLGSGFSSQVRRSSHYTNGQYLLVWRQDDFEPKFEKTSNEEFVLGEWHAETGLIEAVKSVSDGPAEMKINHRFEIYLDETEDLVEYLQWNWKKE